MDAQRRSGRSIQKCLGTRCSEPIYAEIQSLDRDSTIAGRDGIIWIFGNDEPNTYTYRKPVTEIQCKFVLPMECPQLQVSWSYPIGEELQVNSSDFLIRNRTFPCKGSCICFLSSLILFKNPGDMVFTCRISAQTKMGHSVEDEQDFYPNSSGFSQRNSIQEYEKGRSKYLFDRFHTIDYHESPPNITLSAEKCGGPVNATCSSKGGLVELYITSDVESLNRYNGSWFALADNLLSLQNFSEVEINGTYFSSRLFNSSEFLSQEVYVVCRCLDKFSFRRLEAQNCSAISGTQFHLSLLYQCLIIATCLIFIVLMVIVAVWRYLIRRRKRRFKFLRRPSLVYQSIDTVECQQIRPQRHDYANVSIVYCPHRSGSTKPQLGLAESDEDYLEPNQIESKSTSQTRAVRFQLDGKSSLVPKLHKCSLGRRGSHKIFPPRQHRHKLVRSPSLSYKLRRKSSKRATVLRRTSLNSKERKITRLPRPTLIRHFYHNPSFTRPGLTFPFHIQISPPILLPLPTFFPSWSPKPSMVQPISRFEKGCIL
ncbi:hypothetical protein ACTXT7_008826 [Hymenolepis weldensis]